MFKDHFSGHAAQYAAARPVYPAALFDYLASQCEQHDLAWDCATGNGQAAVALTEFFTRVFATDASAAQLCAAREHPQIEYQQLIAGEVPALAQQADLITVAQALHWFDIPAFFKSVEQCLKPGGVLAVWCYGVHSVSPAVDKVVHYLYADILGEFWPLERRFVEASYNDIEFPWPLAPTPVFDLTVQWNLEALRAYLRSWSALQRYQKSRNEDPLLLVDRELAAAWGETKERQVNWPIHLKLSQKPL